MDTVKKQTQGNASAARGPIKSAGEQGERCGWAAGAHPVAECCSVS